MDAHQANKEEFLGTCQGKFHGEPFVNLVLRLKDGKLTGTLSRFTIKMDGSGNLVEAERGEEGGWHIVEAKLEDSTLTLRCQDEQSGEVNQFELRLTRDNDNAEFRPLDTPFPVKPWKMTRTSPTGSFAVRPGGPVEGVVGGVINGVPGGAKGGVIGGVPGAVQRRSEQAEGSISGTVSDPSGARVPGAFVSVSNGKTGLSKTIVTDDAGNFLLIGSLSPGNYELEVRKPGFEITRLDVVLGSPLGNAGEFNLQLKPETVLQAVEVTAKAPLSYGTAPAKARPQRIRVGGLVEATKLIAQTKPEYPESARSNGIQGIVMLEAVISMEGVPLSLHVVQSPDRALSDAAMGAVKQWRYEPTRLNGEPVEVVTEIAVRFKLEN